MPAQSLHVPYDTFLDRNQRLGAIGLALPTLEPALQKAVAELLFMRLFDDLQEALSGTACRLACGTAYLDGTAPNLLTTAARSAASARVLFETHNRAKPHRVRWSRAEYVKAATKHVIAATDPYVQACDAHSLTISEMQAIRNRIAHRNANTRASFDVVLRRYYGTAPTSITPGLLLLTQRFAPTLLNRYLTATRVIAKDCVRA